ncbi:LuxR C-terminal-related transcriptional regulator [Dryocola sp. BD626]|uniref:LuxR C-terminal-related transcriptional regulator n=1 Tax=Dryocola sp. BD626 TaxID=3133273 RepID=UPI003F50AB44
MFNHIALDAINNTYLKNGIAGLLEDSQSFSYFKSRLLDLQESHNCITFTDQISVMIKKLGTDHDDLIVYCDDDVNIDGWTWLPSDFLSWKHVFSLSGADSIKIEKGRMRKVELTVKENLVLRMSAEGLCRDAISGKLSMPTRTVNYLKSKGMKKLGISGNLELLVWREYSNYYLIQNDN